MAKFGKTQLQFEVVELAHPRTQTLLRNKQVLKH